MVEHTKNGCSLLHPLSRQKHFDNLAHGCLNRPFRLGLSLQIDPQKQNQNTCTEELELSDEYSAWGFE